MACFHCSGLANCGSHSGHGLVGELPSVSGVRLEKKRKRTKAGDGEARRRNKMSEQKQNEIQNTIQGQEIRNQETNLSEEDLKNVSGGAFLGEYVLLIGGVLLLLK
jgi:hypothetical protein